LICSCIQMHYEEVFCVMFLHFFVISSTFLLKFLTIFHYFQIFHLLFLKSKCEVIHLHMVPNLFFVNVSVESSDIDIVYQFYQEWNQQQQTIEFLNF